MLLHPFFRPISADSESGTGRQNAEIELQGLYQIKHICISSGIGYAQRAQISWIPRGGIPDQAMQLHEGFVKSGKKLHFPCDLILYWGKIQGSVWFDEAQTLTVIILARHLK